MQILNEINTSTLKKYTAPSNKIVWRAEHPGKSGKWFAFDKNDALGYSNFGSKLIKKNISNKNFIYKVEVINNGTLFEEIVHKYPKLFKAPDDEYGEFEIDASDSVYYDTISEYLIDLGFSGIFTNKKLSIDYEIYIF